MEECELCGSEGSRMQVNHKEHGKIMVCRECWKQIYAKGQKICEGTSSGQSTFGGCPTCK